MGRFVGSVNFGVLLYLAVGSVSSQALGFCRTRTCEQSPRPKECGPPPIGRCEDLGEPLIIPNACISFSIDEAGSVNEGITADQLEEVVTDVFDQWQTVDCGDGRPPSLRVDAYPRTTCSDIGFTLHQRNQNVWTFVDSGWLSKGRGHTATALAMTTVQFHPDTGTIYGADVEINSDLFDFTLDALDGSDATHHDLRGILQHESGHYFGLSHSFVEGATMETYALPADELTIRTLDTDDVAGICAVYPPGTDLSGRSSDPLGGFSIQCDSDSEEGACCTIGPGRRSSRQRDAWILLAASVCCALRRSKLVQPIVLARSLTRK